MATKIEFEGVHGGVDAETLVESVDEVAKLLNGAVRGEGGSWVVLTRVDGERPFAIKAETVLTLTDGE
jgi:hypothetical protein